MSGVNKIIFGDETLLDISEDTVSPYRLLKGYKAHTADGTQVDGLYDPNATNILTTRRITVNGTYEADDDRALGYSEVTVNVPGTFYKRLIEKNGTYKAEDEDIDGFSQIRVDTEEIEPLWDYKTTIDEVLQERELDFVTVSTTIDELPYGFSQGSAVVYNNEIHILGGYNTQSRHYKYNGYTWTSVSSLPYNFYYGSAVVYNNEIHILGSQKSGCNTKHYAWDGSDWSPVSTMPDSLYRSSAVVYNNEIHIFCNSEKHYKWDGSDWSLVSTMPYNLYTGSAVVYNNEIHILGGIYEDFFKQYKWDGTQWNEVSTLPYSFGDNPAVVYNNEIHIMQTVNTVDRYGHYKWNGTSWEPLSIMPYVCSAGSGVIYNNKIHILGSLSYNYPRNYHYVYSGPKNPVRSLCWRSLTDLPSDVYGLSTTCDVCNNTIHIIVGYRSSPTKHYKWNGTSWETIQFITNNPTVNSSVVFNDELYLISYDSSESASYFYKWNGISWSQISTVFPGNVSTISLVVYNNEIHMLGTFIGNDSSFRKKHYKWNGSSWDSVSTLPFDFRQKNGAVVYDNKIHIIGRDFSGGSSYIGHHYAWDGTQWDEVSTISYSYTGQFNSYPVVYEDKIHLIGTTSQHFTWDGTEWKTLLPFPCPGFSIDAVMVLDDKIHVLSLSESKHFESYYDDVHVDFVQSKLIKYKLLQDSQEES